MVASFHCNKAKSTFFYHHEVLPDLVNDDCHLALGYSLSDGLRRVFSWSQPMGDGRGMEFQRQHFGSPVHRR